MLGSTVIDVLGIGSGNITLEDSASSIGAEEDCNVTLKSSDTESKKQDFQKAET